MSQQTQNDPQRKPNQGQPQNPNQAGSSLKQNANVGPGSQAAARDQQYQNQNRANQGQGLGGQQKPSDQADRDTTQRLNNLSQNVGGQSGQSPTTPRGASGGSSSSGQGQGGGSSQSG